MFIRFALGAVLASSFLSSPLSAATVDQDNTGFVPFDRYLGIVASQLSQSFNVGLSGFLDTVTFQARESEATNLDLTFQVRRLAGGDLPSSLAADILFSTTISAASIGSAFTTYDIDVRSANIAVTAGDRLSFVVGMNTPDDTNGNYAIGFNTGNPYPQGMGLCGAFADPDAFAYACGTQGDLWFQTQVDTSVDPVPLPAALPLLLGAFGGLAMVRRRKARG